MNSIDVLQQETAFPINCAMPKQAVGGRPPQYAPRHSSSERSERFVRFEPNVRSERVRYFSERETNVQALKRLINLIAVK